MIDVTTDVDGDGDFFVCDRFSKVLTKIVLWKKQKDKMFRHKKSNRTDCGIDSEGKDKKLF